MHKFHPKYRLIAMYKLNVSQCS